jgi:hypothetical protein
MGLAWRCDAWTQSETLSGLIAGEWRRAFSLAPTIMVRFQSMFSNVPFQPPIPCSRQRVSTGFYCCFAAKVTCVLDHPVYPKCGHAWSAMHLASRSSACPSRKDPVVRLHPGLVAGGTFCAAPRRRVYRRLSRRAPSCRGGSCRAKPFPRRRRSGNCRAIYLVRRPNDSA